ncbi:hypothetical protein CCDG5_1381 [[Clostridium] cellulosi]|uniref:Diguanylate cyclase n=1 Tax=[Clostridium] cellulosi TaxID=29343 RepID=A0A078KTK5_9FIRM|nr:hypothetical protein CCDG5_1381 [[Clostridium] cellulosi]
MIELYKFALNSIDIGVIIIDSSQTITFWNEYMERISQIHQSEALGRKLSEICETFKKKLYQDIIESALLYNQSRFCSSKLHKAFVYPKEGNIENIRQNMNIKPAMIGDETYAIIQIDDITAQVSNEYKMTSLINELKKGYLEIKESEQINRQLARRDPLTKLANRHAIMQLLDNTFKDPKTLQSSALLFLDLDGFKSVNDTYGHLMGDNLLVRVAGILKSKVRKDDVVARLGGDEFIIFISNIDSIESLETIGNKLVSEIAKPILIDGTMIHVTVSIGIAPYDDSIKNSNDFIKVADQAMYCAKREGKNKFVIYDKKIESGSKGKGPLTK